MYELVSLFRQFRPILFFLFNIFSSLTLPIFYTFLVSFFLPHLFFFLLSRSPSLKNEDHHLLLLSRLYIFFLKQAQVMANRLLYPFNYLSDLPSRVFNLIIYMVLQMITLSANLSNRWWSSSNYTINSSSEIISAWWLKHPEKRVSRSTTTRKSSWNIWCKVVHCSVPSRAFSIHFWPPFQTHTQFQILLGYTKSHTRVKFF